MKRNCVRASLGRGAAAMLLSAVVTAAATPSVVRADDASSAVNSGIDAAGGAKIYAQICQGCHMPDGAGASGAGRYPKLAGDPKLGAWAYVAETVLRGRNAMPPFGVASESTEVPRAVHLSDAQIADVVNYVRTHFGNAYPQVVTAAQVTALPHPGSSAPP